MLTISGYARLLYDYYKDWRSRNQQVFSERSQDKIISKRKIVLDGHTYLVEERINQQKKFYVSVSIISKTPKGIDIELLKDMVKNTQLVPVGIENIIIE